MSNEDSIVIQPNGEVISPPSIKPDVIVFDEEKRQMVIQVLRKIPAFFDFAKTLSEGKTYRVYITPEILGRMKEGSARLVHTGSGLLSATIRDVTTGQIIDHASLVEVMPDLLGSLNQLAIQQYFADMIYRLDVIDEKITAVLQGQMNDRLAEIESGIQTYEQAMAASEPDRGVLLRGAILQLNEGRIKLIKSTDISFIDLLPRDRLGMWFYSLKHGNINEYVESKAKSVWIAAHAIIKASRYLALAFSTLNQYDSLRVLLEQVNRDVKVFQDRMEEIVRWLPPTDPWRESLTVISRGVLPDISDEDGISQKTIVLEFQPNEIVPIEGV